MTLTDERRDMVVENRGLVFAVMRSLGVHHAGWAEAEAEAMLALSEAAATYDPERGRFSTWAWPRVRWALVDWIDRTNKRGRREVLFELDSPEEPADTSPEGEAENRAALERIAAALTGASPLTRRVAGLALVGHTNDEIAALLSVSVNTVVRRRKVAQARLAPLRAALHEEA